MSRLTRHALAFAIATAALTTGCAGSPPAPYTELGSSAQLRPNTRGDTDKIPYAYDTAAPWRDYFAAIVEPVTVYRGPDHRFDDLDEDEKQELARYMRAEFGDALGRKFQLTDRVRPGTLRVRLTLTGAEKNTAVVSTFTRFDLVGLPYNAIQGMRGKEGIFMGSVSYSVEIYDAQSNQLLKAYVARQHPNAMNVAATIGALSAAKTGLDNGAKDLVRQLR